MSLRNNNRSLKNFPSHEQEFQINKFYSYFDESIEEADDENPGSASINGVLGERLPVLANANDAREMVRFLKYSPTGLPVLEVLNAEPRRVFDARKIAAYEYWGIIKRVGDLFKLTDVGNKLANLISAEGLVFEEVIASSRVYLGVVEWINQKKLRVITHHDTTEFWRQTQNEPSRTQNDKDFQAEAVSFFSICHAAQLGVATIGKRGQPTRLRVNLQSIQDFLFRMNNKDGVSFSEDSKMAVSQKIPEENYQKPLSDILRVYVSGKKDDDVVENLCNALDLADFVSIIHENSSRAASEQLEKIKIMQACQAGVVIIKDENCDLNSKEETEIKGESFTEIAAALALFNWRLIIIWDCQLPVPQYLSQYNLPILSASENNLRTSYQTVRLLKNMKITDEN